jgi:hypothetical protein
MGREALCRGRFQEKRLCGACFRVAGQCLRLQPVPAARRHRNTAAWIYTMSVNLYKFVISEHIRCLQLCREEAQRVWMLRSELNEQGRSLFQHLSRHRTVMLRKAAYSIRLCAVILLVRLVGRRT